jgi:oxaloacetate decarboxylase gamma subunit
MELNLLIESAKFMVLGMGIVLSFLVLLVFLLKLQHKIINRYFKSNKQSNKLDEKTVAAIIAAVQHHRNSTQG